MTDKIPDLVVFITDAEMAVVEEAHRKLREHIMENLESGGSIGAHLDIAAREMAVVLALADHYAATKDPRGTLGYDDFNEVYEQLFEMCFARAQKLYHRAAIGDNKPN